MWFCASPFPRSLREKEKGASTFLLLLFSWRYFLILYFVAHLHTLSEYSFWLFVSLAMRRSLHWSFVLPHAKQLYLFPQRARARDRERERVIKPSNRNISSRERHWKIGIFSALLWLTGFSSSAYFSTTIFVAANNSVFPLPLSVFAW